MLRAHGISKRFGPTLALDKVSVTVERGEIHAIVGENGAGKSTLINILAGRLEPDQGELLLDGVELQGKKTSTRTGVAAVFQLPMLFERMTWVENLALGAYAARGPRLQLNRVEKLARKLARELAFELPPPEMRVADCSIGQRVRLEILRALSFSPQILILDEPTSVLASAELEAFLELLRQLRASGRSVMLVTHKLAEAMAVADRITVLRRGRKIAERAPAQTTDAELASMIIGDAPVPPDTASDSNTTGGGVLLTLDELVCMQGEQRVLDRLSLEVRAREIVGVAGVEGNGQTELAALLAGLLKAVRGRLSAPPPNRLAIVPQNRDLDGLILTMGVWENLPLSAELRSRFARAGWLARKRARDFCRGLLARAAIRADSTDLEAGALSGGNRQRLMIARALAGSPSLLVAHDPCRGMDVRARAAAHWQLRNYVRTGGAVLLISSELDEVFALCSRVYVINRGRLTEVAPHDREPSRLGLMMSGAA